MVITNRWVYFLACAVSLCNAGYYSSDDDHDPFHAIDNLFLPSPHPTLAVLQRQKRTCHPSLAAADSPAHKRMRSMNDHQSSPDHTIATQIQSIETRLAVVTTQIALCNTQLQKNSRPPRARTEELGLGNELEVLVDAHDDDLQKVHAELTELTQQLQILKNEPKFNPRAIATLNKNVKEIEEKIGHTRLRDEAFTRELKTHTSQLKSLHESIGTYGTKLQTLETKLTSNKNTTDHSQLSHLNRQVKTIFTRLEPIQDTLNTHNERFINSARAQQVLQKEVAELKEIAERLEQLKNLTLTVAQLYEQLAPQTLYAAIDRHAGELEKHADKLEKINTDIVHSHEQLTQAHDQIAALTAWQQTFDPPTIQHTVDMHDNSLHKLYDDVQSIRAELQQVQQAQTSSSSQQFSDWHMLSTRLDTYAQEIEMLKNALTLKDDIIVRHQETYNQQLHIMQEAVNVQNTSLQQLHNDLRNMYVQVQQLQSAQSSYQVSAHNIALFSTMLNTHAEEIQQLKYALAAQARNTTQSTIIESNRPATLDMHYQFVDALDWGSGESYIPITPTIDTDIDQSRYTDSPMLLPMINDNTYAGVSSNAQPSSSTTSNELREHADLMESLAREWTNVLLPQISRLSFKIVVERINRMLSRIPDQNYQLAHRMRIRLANCYLDQFEATGNQRFLEEAQEIYTSIKKDNLGAQTYGTYSVPDANRGYAKLTSRLINIAKKATIKKTPTHYLAIAPKL